RKVISAYVESQTCPTNRAQKLPARGHGQRPDKATGSQSEIPISDLFGDQQLLSPTGPWIRPALARKKRPARCKRWMKLRPRKCAADPRTDEALLLVAIRQLRLEQICYSGQL